MIRNAASVTEYLASLTPDERKDIQKVRAVIRRNLPRGYKESVQYGMICYSVPLARYSGTYNGQALCYAALAAQKNHHSLYLMSVYSTDAEVRKFKQAYKATGKKLDMGRACIRFQSADDLPLPLIGKTIAKTTVDDFITGYEKIRANTRTGKKAAGKAARKK
jgi:uncharacterized protein YdhG (YjbR/CyaY superfamily)